METTINALPQLWAGLQVTVQVAAGAFLVALAFSFAAGLARLSPNILVRGIAVTYIEVFRGTSALVQLFWLFYVLPFFGVLLTPIQAGIIGLGLCTGAYGAEIVRAAVIAVPHGQRDAAVALNLTPFETLRHVVLPQAAIMILPPFGNLAIEIIKLTSLVSLVTLSDLTFVAHSINAVTMRAEEIFLVVLVIYFVLGSGVGFLTRALERRVGRGFRAVVPR